MTPGTNGHATTRVPARDPIAVSVGATTIDRCLASYSNTGARLDLVAPGGDDDALSLFSFGMGNGHGPPPIKPLVAYRVVNGKEELVRGLIRKLR